MVDVVGVDLFVVFVVVDFDGVGFVYVKVEECVLVVGG